MVELYRRKPRYWHTSLRLSLLQTLVDILKKYPPRPITSQIPDRPLAEQMFAVVDFVRQNLGRRLSIDDAADHACMGRTTFIRAFRQFMGISFAQYLLNARLELAHEAVLKGEKKLATIARECGFYDASHFISHYFRHFGHTPGKRK
jgi:transcriptional regulator GlxA family with amidase domain